MWWMVRIRSVERRQHINIMLMMENVSADKQMQQLVI